MYLTRTRRQDECLYHQPDRHGAVCALQEAVRLLLEKDGE
jgi:hypothetical protein